MNKIFWLGFNKTGTTSIHNLFKGLGFKSYHNATWVIDSINHNKTKIDKYDCFTDGLGFSDIDWLTEEYPNSKFILNVRKLDKWILSCYNHNWKYNKINKNKNKRTIDENWVLNRIIERNYWHKYVLDYFNDILVIDITKEDKLKELSEYLNIGIKSFSKNNISNISTDIKIENKKIIDNILHKNYINVDTKTYDPKLIKEDVIDYYNNKIASKRK